MVATRLCIKIQTGFMIQAFGFILTLDLSKMFHMDNVCGRRSYTPQYENHPTYTRQFS